MKFQLTGVTISDITCELKKAVSEGHEQILSFLSERVYSKNSSLRDSVPKTKESASQLIMCNKYRGVKKKRPIKWKKTDYYQ